jgi:hypothetical protein
MTNEQQEKLKAIAEQECNARLAHGNAGAAIGGLEYQQARSLAEPTLRERIRNQRCRAQNESRRLEQLHELEYLLEKHPEVARILELMEAVRD